MKSARIKASPDDSMFLRGAKFATKRERYLNPILPARVAHGKLLE